MADLTTSNGAPIVDDQNSMTAGERGPVLMQIGRWLKSWLTLIVSGFQNVLCMRKGRGPMVRLP